MDIFVLPSYREGFPRSVLEAMATGLPVVSTNIRGCREAVVAGETGLLAPPRDSDALTRAVRTLIDNREMRLRMGAAGRRRVLEKFDEARMTAIFIRNAIATMAKAGVPVPVSNAGLS
jgi:glycosyltransferase involved in cell wall biosynthesis